MNATEAVLEDGPLGGLPLHDEKTIFDRTYIDLVALEVRWSSPIGNIEESAAVQIRDAIEDRLGDLRLQVIERVEQRSLTVVLEDETETTQRDVEYGHVLRTEDQRVAVTLLPQSLGIQLGTYERWGVSARPLLEAALSAALETLGSGLVSRVGLRYVNRIHDESCSSAQDWIGKISPALLAPYSDWGMKSWVSAAREQIEFAIDENHGAVLRHGLLSPANYLIDVDVFSQRTRVMNAEGLVHSFTRMNRTALAIFQQSVPIDYLLSRQPEEGES